MLLKMKKIVSLALAVTMISSIFTGCAQHTKGASSDTKSITDVMGRKVDVSKNPQKLAAIVGPSYEKIFLLGEADKIVYRIKGPTNSPWTLKTNPKLKDILEIKNPQKPNVEELVNAGVDSVFFWADKDQISKMESVKLPVIVTQNAGGGPDSVEKYIEYQKNEIRLYGDVLGENAKRKAEKWCDYFDKKIKYVTSKTSKLSKDEIKKVYYARSDNALTCFSRNSTPQFLIEMAGGVSVAKDTKEPLSAKVTIEQIMKWDPDVIFMGRMDTTDAVLKDKKWADITAVKNKQVYLCPNGVMFWDYGSENILLLEYIASKLHPELFKDLDMKKEVKEYYKEFFNYELSDDDAERILNHLPPM